MNIEKLIGIMGTMVIIFANIGIWAYIPAMTVVFILANIIVNILSLFYIHNLTAR